MAFSNMASGVAIFSSFIQPISAAVRAVLRRIYVLGFLHVLESATQQQQQQQQQQQEKQRTVVYETLAS